MLPVISCSDAASISMNPPASESFLQKYVTERLPDLIPGIFDGAPDLPSFTVDQRSAPLQQPPYPI
jgi:hypothetical protein